MTEAISEPNGEATTSLSTAGKVETASSEEQEPVPLYMKFMSWLLRRSNEPKRPKNFEPIPRFDFAERSESVSSGKTVLYLAYGSNLCAATFQGQRAIRPISALNVSVPDLELVFDLPGMIYWEPRFANTRFRSSESADLVREKNPNEKSALLPEKTTASHSAGTASSLGWDKGLVGVVYEITAEEMRHVMKTEGGGYVDIEIPCYALEQGAALVPNSHTGPTLTAHTLLAKEHSTRGPGQPSKRYLSLLKSGAREHDLPKEFQSWLSSLEPYIITTVRQSIGLWVFNLTWAPCLMVFYMISSFATKKNGRPHPWIKLFMNGLFKAVWISYDYGFKWVFGDGEKTIR